MADIFISYAKEDKTRAAAMAKALENKGWSVWWDRKIPPGKTFSGVIEKAIKDAKCVIVLWSNNSIKSDWVQIEASEGAKRKILVPTLIEKVKIPLEFSRIQAADLTDWKPESTHAEFIIFLDAITEIVGPTSAKGQTEGEPQKSEPKIPSNIQPAEKETPKSSPPRPMIRSKGPILEMADIFISFAKEDRSRVEPLAKALEKSGWSVWWDRTIPPGKAFDQVIEEAISAAKCLVVLWSQSSVKSDCIKEEASIGKLHHILTPAKIDSVEPPMGFGLIQTPDLTDWKGEVDNPQYRQLIKAIECVVGREKPPGQASQTEIDAAKLSERADRCTVRETQDVIYAYRGGYELVRIPGGEFLMGSPDTEEGRFDREGLQHTVSIPDFYMGRYPVTNEEYGRFLVENADAAEPEYRGDREYNQPRQPVVGLSWEDAQQYARWAGLQLPSEAQWEYACRAGTQTRFCSGNMVNDLDRVGWYYENSNLKPYPVGEKEPNAFGLYDMHGNVDEWVEDDYHDTYIGGPEDGRAWIDAPRGLTRVVRGGSWLYSARLCRSASRCGDWSGARNSYLGFRLVLPTGQPA